jgi:hypothetical protein
MIAFVIYGISGKFGPSALDEGRKLFGEFDLHLSEVLRYRETPPDGAGENIHLVETNLVELDEELAALGDETFYLYDTSSKEKPWRASYSVHSSRYGSFPHIQGQLPGTLGGYPSALSNFLSRLTETIPYRYAIAFDVLSASLASNYCLGEGVTGVFPYENVFAFSQEQPGRFGGKERYLRDRLRMVYPVNVLNDDHLSQRVGDSTLGEFASNHGVLTKFPLDLSLWVVAPNHIDEINQQVGEAGLSISWRRPATARPRLP